MDAVLAAFFVLLVLVVAVILFARIFANEAFCLPALNRWAKEENLEILDRASDWLDVGPFFWHAAIGKKVYRIRALRDGKEAVAYVSCGHWLLGALRPVVTVRWEDPR